MRPLKGVTTHGLRDAALELHAKYAHMQKI